MTDPQTPGDIRQHALDYLRSDRDPQTPATAYKGCAAHPGLDAPGCHGCWMVNHHRPQTPATEYERNRRDMQDPAFRPEDDDPQTPATDYLRGKDISMAEHSDTRSECPSCGEWRDSPKADCAGCGWTDPQTPATEAGPDVPDAARRPIDPESRLAWALVMVGAFTVVDDSKQLCTMALGDINSVARRMEDWLAKR